MERAGAIVGHVRPDDGAYCEGAIIFDSSTMRRLNPARPRWQVLSWEPLTLTPSLLCKARRFGPDGPIPGTECGDHGFIRGGRWERA